MCGDTHLQPRLLRGGTNRASLPQELPHGHKVAAQPSRKGAGPTAPTPQLLPNGPSFPVRKLRRFYISLKSLNEWKAGSFLLAWIYEPRLEKK